VFELDRPESLKLDSWLRNEIFPKVVERQMQCPELACMIVEDEGGHKIPYLGAIGGAITYSFTPTSLGTVIKVTWDDGVINETLDLTNYDYW
jgi:hypothetical protein